MGRISLPTEIVRSSKTPRTAIAIDKTSGVKQQADTAREVNLVGQMNPSGAFVGTATAATPYNIYRDTDGEALFGQGSMLDFAIKHAFKANPYVRLTATPVADAGVKATATVTLAVNAAVSTRGILRIAGVRVYYDITTGDTPTVQATALAAAINANKSLPVTATSALGVVTITAKGGGTVFNGIQLRFEFEAPTTVATTATLSATALSGGTGSADITSALAALTGKRYEEIAVLLDDATAGASGKAHVNSQSDGEHMHGCFAHQAVNNTLSTATTMATTLNGDRNQIAAINGSESWSVAIAAELAAVMASEEDATRPLNTLKLPGILPPPVEKRWSRTETDSLLANGVTPLVVFPGEEVGIMRAVTTGVTNSAGDHDYSTLDITIWRGLDDIRDNLALMFNTHYPRAKWADEDPDGLLPVDVATPSKVGQDILDVLRDGEERGIVQQVEANKGKIVVEKAGTQCIFSAPADIIDGMHERLGKLVLLRQNVTSV